MSDIGMKGLRLKFCNRFCSCPYRKKVEIRISESENNPGRLFFRCVDDKCGYFEWWRPSPSEIVNNGRDDATNLELLSQRLSNVADTCFLISTHIQQNNHEIKVTRRVTLFLLCLIALVWWKVC